MLQRAAWLRAPAANGPRTCDLALLRAVQRAAAEVLRARARRCRGRHLYITLAFCVETA